MPTLKCISTAKFESLLFEAGFSIRTPLKIAVAVSGGADSLSLTYLLKNYLQKRGGDLVALTVDHGLREESPREALDVQKIVTNLGIKHHILTWQGDKPKAALQERARQERYDLLESWCFENGYNFLFLAHHKQDQSETYCMRLRRQSGLLGLACMRPITKRQRLTLVRPFLTTSKQELVDTLKNQSISWIEDPSNQNRSFERVFWRQILSNFNISLDSLQKVRAAYEGWVRRYLEAHGTCFELGYLTFEKKAFYQLPRSFQKILFSFVLRSYGVGKYPPSDSSIECMLNKINDSAFTATTLQGMRISSHQKKIHIIREYRAIREERDLNPEQSCFIWDKRFMVLADQMPQGVIKSIGEKGWLQLLNCFPEFKDIEIPRAVLWSLPALWVNGKIHPELNMVYELFKQEYIDSKQKKFTFYSKSPF